MSVASPLKDYLKAIRYPVFSFNGGLNTHSSRLLLKRNELFAIQPDQCTVLNNLDTLISGVAQTRPASIKLHSAAIVPGAGDGEIRSLFQLKQKNGNRFLLCNAGNGIYLFNWGTLSWSLLGTVATSNERFVWCQLADLAIGISPSNAPVKYDGVNLAALGGTPPNKGTAICAYRNRVYIAKDLSLYFSDSGAPNTWQVADVGWIDGGVIPIPAINGNKCLGLFPFYNRLMVWTNAEVLGLLGVTPLNYQFELSNSKYGHQCSAAWPLAAGNDVYFAERRGVHALQTTEAYNTIGDIKEQYSSGVIEPTWAALNAANLPNRSAFDATSDSQFFVLVGENSANNDTAYVADYYHVDQIGRPTWSRYSNYNFSCGLEVINDSTGATVIIMGGYNGFVYRQDKTTAVDDGGVQIPIRLDYLTDIEQPDWVKLWRHIILWVSPPSVLFQVTQKYLGVDWILGVDPLAQSSQFNLITSFDFGHFTNTQQILRNVANEGQFAEPRVSITGTGRFITLSFQYTGTTPITIAGFEIYANLRRNLP